MEGILIDEDKVELYLEGDTTLFIDMPLLLEAVGLDNFEEIMANGSFCLNVVCLGETIVRAKQEH